MVFARQSPMRDVKSNSLSERSFVMCYEDWYERKKMMEELTKSKEKADALIKKIKSTTPNTKPDKQPAVEREKVTTQ